MDKLKKDFNCLAMIKFILGILEEVTERSDEILVKLELFKYVFRNKWFINKYPDIGKTIYDGLLCCREEWPSFTDELDGYLEYLFPLEHKK